MMGQKGLKIEEIAPCFGPSSLVYAGLNWKRNLNLAMIRQPRVVPGFPADALTEASALKKEESY